MNETNANLKSGKTNKILVRIFAAFSCIVLINTLLFAILVIPLQKESLRQVMYTQAETVSRSIIQAGADAMMSDDYGFLVEHGVQVIKKNNGIHYIFLESSRGTRIWIDKKHWEILEQTPQDFEALKNRENFLHLIRHDPYNDVYHFAYPIEFSAVHWGWLHIGFSTEQFRASLRAMYYQIGSIAAVLIVASLIIGFWFARWISVPISTISKLALRVANGDLDATANIHRNDEIGQLTRSFNDMVSALKLSKLQQENYNQTLERQVAQRTQELDKLNQSLDQRVKDEVAARRQQEQLLIYQSRLAAMGEMIGAIAHQWRQPLNALGLVLQNIQITYEAGRLNDTFLNRSVEKANRLIGNMSNTIDDFRNFFRPNKHQERFLVVQALKNVADLLDASLAHNQIELKIDCKDDIAIVGYQSELSQVLLNLINNARDICVERKTENPRIFIQVTQKADITEISVADNGGGVPDSISDKIYDPYFTTKEEGRGTGIGLYMSKMIIESNMGGHLSNHNTDSGSCFTIRIGNGINKPSAVMPSSI